MYIHVDVHIPNDSVLVCHKVYRIIVHRLITYSGAKMQLLCSTCQTSKQKPSTLAILCRNFDETVLANMCTLEPSNTEKNTLFNIHFQHSIYNTTQYNITQYNKTQHNTSTLFQHNTSTMRSFKIQFLNLSNEELKGWSWPLSIIPTVHLVNSSFNFALCLPPMTTNNNDLS